MHMFHTCAAYYSTQISSLFEGMGGGFGMDFVLWGYSIAVLLFKCLFSPQVRELEGIPLLLNQCHIDHSNPCILATNLLRCLLSCMCVSFCVLMAPTSFNCLHRAKFTYRSYYQFMLQYFQCYGSWLMYKCMCLHLISSISDLVCELLSVRYAIE